MGFVVLSIFFCLCFALRACWVLVFGCLGVLGSLMGSEVGEEILALEKVRDNWEMERGDFLLCCVCITIQHSRTIWSSFKDGTRSPSSIVACLK